MRTTIIIPTYNEKDNIQILIPKIFSILPTISILVVDDNSPDGTGDVVKNILMPSFPKLSLYRREKKEGLGKAYIDTLKKILAGGEAEYVCIMDADLSHDPIYLPLLIEKMSSHDVAVGSRYIPGGSIIGWENWRKRLSGWGNQYARIVTRITVNDCTSGFVCFRTDILRKLDFNDLEVSGYAFQIYLKYKLWKLGARICEVPICFRNRINGESKISMNIIREGLLVPWYLIKKDKEHKKISSICPACKSNETDYWFTKNKCAVHRCISCSLIFTSPIPPHLNELYSEDYFHDAKQGFGYIHYDEDKQADRTTFIKYLERIKKTVDTAGIMLDIGAATGAFLAIAREQGWKTHGMEISAYAAEEGRRKGIIFTTGGLDNDTLAGQTFDAITLWDVFEHLPDPHQALINIARLAKSNGIVALNLPDTNSWWARLLGRRWPLINPPEHLCLYNKKNLSRLLNMHGFKIVEITKIGKRYTPAYIFQSLYTVSHQILWKKLSALFKDTWLNKLSFPINMRDNMFIVAQKIPTTDDSLKNSF